MNVLLDSFPGSLWKVMERYTGAVTSQNCRTSQEFWAAVFQGMQFYTSTLVSTVLQCGTSSMSIYTESRYAVPIKDFHGSTSIIGIFAYSVLELELRMPYPSNYINKLIFM